MYVVICYRYMIVIECLWLILAKYMIGYDCFSNIYDWFYDLFVLFFRYIDMFLWNIYNNMKIVNARDIIDELFSCNVMIYVSLCRFLRKCFVHVAQIFSKNLVNICIVVMWSVLHMKFISREVCFTWSVTSQMYFANVVKLHRHSIAYYYT